MATRTFGRIKVSLPDIEDEMYLGTASNLDRPGGVVSEFRYSDHDLRDLDISQTDLRNGRVQNISADRVNFEGVRISSVEFLNCDLRSWQWTGSKMSRAVFRDCKLMGAVVSGAVFDDVLFENCRLDFTSFDQVRAAGPLVFSQCGLSEASFEGSDLTDAVFADCGLQKVEFGRGKYKDCDLSGSDISSIRGVGALREVVIARVQEHQLVDALLRELNVTYVEDMPAPR